MDSSWDHPLHTTTHHFENGCPVCGHRLEVTISGDDKLWVCPFCEHTHPVDVQALRDAVSSTDRDSYHIHTPCPADGCPGSLHGDRTIDYSCNTCDDVWIGFGTTEFWALLKALHDLNPEETPPWKTYTDVWHCPNCGVANRYVSSCGECGHILPQNRDTT